MTLRVAINGFGRIGRMVYRRAMETEAFHVVAVNGTADSEDLAHLLKYDSVHGTWKQPLQVQEDGWTVAGKKTQIFSTRSIQDLPWGDLGIDIVIEATGAFRHYAGAVQHIEQGARRVLITAPAKGTPGADMTLVLGVNEHMYHPDRHRVVSGASCTTNALGPLAKVLHDAFGIRHGLLTTIHAVTNDQNNLDNPHKDLRRARASHESLIPTTTGAAKAIGLILPELQGRMDGISVRVPVPNVSLVDLVATLDSAVTENDVHRVLEESSLGSLRGILGYTEEPLVSIDFNGDSRSSIVDAGMTKILAGNMVKVLAWYDNEWAYACRMVETAMFMGGASRAEVERVRRGDGFLRGAEVLPVLS